MTETYIERDCSIELAGQTFRALGAMVNTRYAIAYMSSDMRSVINWHGDTLGHAKVISSWQLPSRIWLYQVEAVIDGRSFTGRTQGGSMIWRGRAKGERS